MRRMTVPELLHRLHGTDRPFVVDVREPEELATGTVPGAVNIPADQLAHRVGEIPWDRDVVVVCASGNRSRAAVDELRRAGRRATDLDGGVAAWSVVGAAA